MRELADGSLLIVMLDSPALFAVSAAAGIAVVGAIGLAVLAGRRGNRARQNEHAAAAAIADKARFVALIGHEIRNPLNAILGMSEFLVDGNVTPEHRGQALVIRGAAENLLLVANNLLGYFAGSASYFPKQSTPFELPELLSSIRQSMASIAFQKRLRLQCHFETGSARRVETDPHHVRHIVSNVLAHSLGMTENGSVELTEHRVSDSEPDGASDGASLVRITVTDTGPTLSSAARTALFDAFGLQGYLQDGNPSGTGLALYNALAFARLLGGDVTHQHHEMQGNIYEITLPMRVLTRTQSVESTAAQGVVVELDDPYVRHRSLVGRKRILVAEDVRSNQQVLSGILERAGHAAVLARTGDEALDWLSRDTFDAMIVDLRMPGTSGLDVIKLARVTNAGKHRYTPVIVLTAQLTDKARQACLAAGAAAFLTKPIAAQQLLDALASALEPPSNVEDVPHSAPTMVIDLRISRSLTNPAGIGPIAPRLVSESVRDCLRYMGEIDALGQSQNWKSIRLRVRALRGAAYQIGALRLVEVTNRILDSSQSTLEEHWRWLASDLTNAVETAREALADLFHRAQVSAD